MSKLKEIIKYMVMIGLAIFLLWIAFEGLEVKPGQSKINFILDTWTAGHKGFLFLSAFVAILSHLIRAARWHIILKPLGYSFSITSSFISVMIGYFINLVIPRGGELSRCITLYRLEKVPVKTSLGTVIAERVVDLLFLLLCIGSVFLLEFDKFINFFNIIEGQNQLNPDSATSSNLKFYLLGIIVFIGIIGVFYISKNRRLYLKVLVKGKDFLTGLKEGLLSIFRLEQKFLFIFYSLLIWACYYLMAYTVFLAYPETAQLGLDAALTIFVLGGIAMAIPLPGGTGSYHLLVSQGLLLLYAIPKQSAVGFATIFHGWQTIVIIIVGAICFVLSEVWAKNTYNPEQENETD